MGQPYYSATGAKVEDGRENGLHDEMMRWMMNRANGRASIRASCAHPCHAKNNSDRFRSGAFPMSLYRTPDGKAKIARDIRSFPGAMSIS
jgi:hypothetical protein